MKLNRDHAIAAVTAVLAVGIPAGGWSLVRARTAELAAHIGERGEVFARIGSIDADLTGTIRMRDVALGALFAADSVEASVALDSLFAGHLAADEIRVAGPRIAVQVDRDGDSDLARLVRQLGRPGTTRRAPGPTRLRRIVVTSGSLSARIAGIGELSADGVELVPDGDGVRLITGNLRVRARGATVRGELELSRAAAEVSLPRVTFGRVLAVAGTGTIDIGGRSIRLRDVAIGRIAPGGALEARGFVDDAGIPREVGADLVPPASSGDGFTLALTGDRIPLASFASLAPRGLVLDNARASGELTLRRRASTLQLAAHGEIRGFALDHLTLAPHPIPIDAAAGDAVVALSPEALTIDRAELSIGAARWTMSGWVRRAAPLAGQLDVRLAPAPCQDVFLSLPAVVRGPLDGLALAGTFGARARLSVDLAAPPSQGVDLAAAVVNHCQVLAEPPAADVRRLAVRPPPGASWIELSRLPRHIPGAFVSAEDGRFWDHDGFDVEQIARSFEIDLRDRRLARGGSTISQQLVKNELLTRRRTLDRKIQEALLTWRLEARLDKKQILERYLNIIELGPKIHGLRDAARYWFGVSPRELSIREAAFLAAITSAPTTMSRRVRHAGGLDPESAARVDTVLRAMKRDGVISKEELDVARERPLRFVSTALRSEI
jgi:hypothetical protein